ncbi:hypothetical protein [Paenibacillus lautus]|uniref:hypothetical protein n=1 Tax=Paenibacillus lautus TaxID=1401 RepID=UPI001C7DB41F|nr:hypothetical protein [Paenibacillus lautus]MBX4150095.1 hypothetical protein [Paenibacillus lautus]
MVWGRGEAQRSRARAVYINKPNEPFGAYIPNGLFGFPPSLNHRLGGSNHPRSVAGGVYGGEAKLGAEQRGPCLAMKHGKAVCFEMPTSFLSKLQRSRRNCSGEAAAVPFIPGFQHGFIHSEEIWG